MSYCGLTSFRTISSETSSADATYAQESQISKYLPEVLPSESVTVLIANNFIPVN